MTRQTKAILESSGDFPSRHPAPPRRSGTRRHRSLANTVRPLTERQRKLIDHLSQGMTIKAAAIAAGYSPRSASVLGNKALKAIGERMPEVLEWLGCRDENLITKYLKPLLQAQEIRFFSYKGRITDRAKVAAHDIPLRALDMTFKLKGSYAPVPQEQHVTHTLTTAEINSACNIAERIGKMRVIDIEPLDDGDADGDERPRW